MELIAATLTTMAVLVLALARVNRRHHTEMLLYRRPTALHVDRDLDIGPFLP